MSVSAGGPGLELAKGRLRTPTSRKRSQTKALSLAEAGRGKTYTSTPLLNSHVGPESPVTR